jgi:CheY-like chemotaxis protein
VLLPEVVGFASDPYDHRPSGKWTAPLRVLVVDDIEPNRELVTLRMLQRSHRVYVATDGAKAIEQYLQQSLDLILMDAHMPNMNGFDAIRAIRTHEQGTGSHIPIIMLTASVLDSDRKSCLDAGADAYVPKPIDFRLLFDRIADFFPVVDNPAEPARKASPTRESHDLALIDVAAGIRNWSDPDIYFGWLVRLAADHANMHDAIAEMARVGNVQEAIEYLHTLKGALGNLCIRRLPQVCAAIESELKAGAALPGDLMTDLQLLEIAFRRDIDKIRLPAGTLHALSEQAMQTPAPVIDTGAVVALLARIIPSLEAGEVNDAALASLRDQIGNQRMQKLQDTVADFDFTAAVQAARALMDAIGHDESTGDPLPAGAGSLS